MRFYEQTVSIKTTAHAEAHQWKPFTMVTSVSAQIPVNTAATYSYDCKEIVDTKVKQLSHHCAISMNAKAKKKNRNLKETKY